MLDFSQVAHDATGLTAPETTPWKADDLNESDMVVLEQNPLNLPMAKARFEDFAKVVEQIRTDAKTVSVNNDESLKFAVALGGESKRITKAIETRRKEIINDPGEFVKAVNGFCKLLTDPLAEAESAVKQKISMYQSQIEMERRKAEEAARRAAAELQDKLRREADEANRKAREEAIRQAEEEARNRKASETEIEAARNQAADSAKSVEIEAPTVIAPVFPKAENVVRAESGAAAFQRKSWEFELTDIDAVPRDYLILDEKKVRDAIRMGIRTIPGIRIYEHTSTVFRS
jgi:hypothetical protein